ncbi:alkyl hydroperoxide reductase subunit C [Methanobrevibacter cuticularis]|uniref:Peroxiredoxin n=1 Tax=Methanobrevibacter cuticularis TaxID=47311 RepID=A0A166EQZ6_9EURY|nr:peroxiredoxin [Methanobrevibacter cuticularis]KZX16916.1 alkyl hydroperoxide reductase subunit C [Methanobrevibacter cuticularis]
MKEDRDIKKKHGSREYSKMMPLLGDDFPKLDVQTTLGMMKLPDDFKGKWFVLFSHPSDFTPVCTTEFVSFQKNYEKFKELNCELIGLSVDQVFSHIKWIEWIKDNFAIDIEFPIIADTGAVANTLGIIHPNKGTATVRSVFIIDTNGKIRTIIYYPQELGRNMAEILRAVKGLQIVDKEKVAMPANWPDNELLDENVIVPPEPNMTKIKERFKKAEEGEFACYDWWFCHKKI